MKKTNFKINAIRHLLLSTLLVASIHTALSHGTVTNPPSRVWICFQENPESPDSSACEDAIRGYGTQAFYDWSEVARMDAGGNHRAILPDGNLASAGRPDKYGGLDQVRNDWVATKVSSGPFTVTWTNSAPHQTLYYDVYITKADWTPDQPLTWDSLERLVRTSPRPAATTDDINVTLPQRTGKHILFSVWQRSLTPEAFYSTSDIDFGNASSVNLPPIAEFIADNGQCGGNEVSFDASDSNDPNESPLTYTWDFGDGTTATGVEVSHTFNNINNPSVTLTVSDNTFTSSSVQIIDLTKKPNCEEALCPLDTPKESALTSINTTFEYIYVLGDNGPNLDNVRNFTINWSLANNGLFQIAMNTNDGNPSHYVDLGPISEQNFNAPKPQITITNSRIDKFDGTYFATTDNGNFALVSIDKGFTIYFSTSDTAPICKEDAAPTINTPPIANLKVTPPSGPTPLIVSFDASGSTDVDGDQLNYRIEYGNGNTGFKLNEVSPYTYFNPGEYTVTLVVTDGRGGIDTDSLIVNVGDGTLSNPTFILDLDNDNEKALPFYVFPNPATETITLVNRTSLKDNTISIYSVNGVEIKSVFVKEDAKNQAIDVSSIPSGLYFIKTIDATGISGRALKFIKQ